jgi:carboxypeptidase D
VGRCDQSLEFRSRSHGHVAYYNAGSSAIVLIIILAALGTILWCRIRRRRLRGLPVARNEEEHIPLTQSLPVEESESPLEHSGASLRKGKERAKEIGSAPLFDVGDSDEDEPIH